MNVSTSSSSVDLRPLPSLFTDGFELMSSIDLVKARLPKRSNELNHRWGFSFRRFYPIYSLRACNLCVSPPSCS
ncbi:hypothetical protein L1887_36387 [Cichorium endivia]|nr:hypothetical protein L1887_36387 [Cichorium endivia]